MNNINDVNNLLLSVLIKLEHDCNIVDNKFREKRGYGACPVFATKVFELVGGKVIAGDYEETRHYWVEKDDIIYDMNNIDLENNVKFSIRHINDNRYDKSRFDSYVLNSVYEIRDSVEELGLMTEYEFDDLYKEIKITENIFYIPLDIAWEARAKWAYPGTMEAKRTDITMLRIESGMKKGRFDPITVTIEELRNGTLSEGKHRLIIAKKIGIENVPIIIQADKI